MSWGGIQQVEILNLFNILSAPKAVVYQEGTKVVAKDDLNGVIREGTLGTDDATVIRAAMSHLSAGGWLHIKRGTYTLGSVVATNIILDIEDYDRSLLITGEGVDTTILKVAAGLSAARYLISRSASSNQQRLIIKDMTIDWNGNNQDYTGVMSEQITGIYLSANDYSIIENVKFKSHYMKNGGSNTFGIGLNDFDAKWVKVIDCIFDDNDTGIWVTNQPVDNGPAFFTAIRPVMSGIRGVGVKTEATSDVTIIDPYFAIGTVLNARAVSFEPSPATDCRNYNLIRPLCLDPNNKSDVMIFVNANVLNVVIEDPEIDCAGTGIQSYAANTRIVNGGRIYSGSTSIALSQAGTLAEIDSIEVKSTNHAGIQSSAKLFAQGVIAHDCSHDGIDLRAAGSTLIGCKAYNNGKVGATNNRNGITIHFNGTTNVVVQGCECYDTQGIKTQEYGIKEDGDFTPNSSLFIGNRVHDNKLGNYSIVGAATRVLKDPNYVTEANKLSGTFLIDSTGVKTVTIAHGLNVTPALEDCAVSVVEDSAVDDWAYNLLKVTAVDATNVTVKINVSTASLTAAATAKIALRVGRP